MSSFEARCFVDRVRRARRTRHVLAFAVALLTSSGFAPRAEAQAQPQGFAVERFYTSAPGGGWFVMDDLNMQGELGGAVTLASGYARQPLKLASQDGTQHLSLVSDEAFVDVGLAATHDRYRVYLNFPMPLLVKGASGMLGPYQLTAPSVNVGTNPDSISDLRVGFDVRVFGEPLDSFRLGVGTQLIIPFGARADYVTDGTFRGMFRGLVAGDVGRFSYAGQVGVHVRPLDDSLAPGSPYGSELLFGAGVGRRISLGSGRVVTVGPELYGETGFRSLFGAATGFEGLLTGRVEGTGDGSHVRVKVGVGGGLDQHFGAPAWRVVVGVELFGQRTGRGARGGP